MAGVVSNIWRHPIKGIGCEAVEHVSLQADRTMPWDRVWAVMHEASKFSAAAPEWASKQNFNQGAKTPAFMAIKAVLNEGSGEITLTHPELATLTVNPDVDPAALVAWVEQLVPENRAQPVGVAKLDGRGFTDQKTPYISITGTASLAALSGAAGQSLQQERFRANFWVEGLAPWEEFSWIGKTIRLGTAILRVDKPVGRCVATTANADTGKIDVDTLAILEANYGHTDLGVFAEVIEDGDVAISHKVEVL